MPAGLRMTTWGGNRNSKPYRCKLEFLESTGTQWIDTGILGSNALAFHLTAKAQVLNTNFFCGCVGSNGASEMQRLIGAASGGVVYYVLQRGEFSIVGRNRIVADGNWHTYKLSSTEAVIDSDTKSSGTISDCNRTFLLFAAVTAAGVVTCGKCCISACKIYVNGVLVRDFIPVLDWRDVACMYDKVSGKLFYNAGTGEFVAGPEIHPVEYIKSLGTQYIKVPLRPSSSCDITADFQVSTFAQGAPFGGGDGNLSNEILVLPRTTTATSTDWIYRCKDKQKQDALTVSYYDRHTIRWVQNSAYLDGILYSGLTEASTFSASRDYIGLFCSLRNGDTSPAFLMKGRLFSAQMTDGSSSFRFSPIRVGSGSTWEGALLDEVSHRVYRNAGTGPFVIGPGKDGWFNPYVTDGLVAMWDGEWNAGPGMHDSNATKWVDLSGRAFDFDVPNTLSWSDDALVFPPDGDKNTNRLYTNHSFTQNKTIEVVAKFNKNESSILRVYSSNTILFHWGFSFFWDGTNRGGGNLSVGTRHYAAVCIDGADGFRVYRDGLVQNGTAVLSPIGETAFTVGYYNSTTYALNGDVCAIRFYNRSLTAEEIAANRAVDVERFNLPTT